jgi:hypothetical protein
MNGGFEAGTSGWTGAGSELTVVDSPVRSGNFACRSHDRHMYWEGVRQTITDVLKDHGPGKYTIEAWVRTGSGTVYAYLRFKLVDDAGESYPGATTACGSDAWKKISFSQTVNWKGTLGEAVFELMTTESDLNLPDLYVDDCQILTPPGSTQKIGGMLIPGITDDVLDGKPDAGAYEYGGTQESWKAGASIVTALPGIADLEQDGSAQPPAFRLSQNAPNPFHGSTTIQIGLPEESEVRFEIFNVRGELINTHAMGQISAGVHRLVWDGTDASGRPCASGVYILRVCAKSNLQEWSANGKMVLVR